MIREIDTAGDLRSALLLRPWYTRFPRLSAGGPMSEVVKRGLDLFLCSVAIPLILPVIAILSVAIALESRGNPIFTQERTGRGGRRFRMYKLRTMVRDAERQKHHYADLNERSFPDFKVSRDPRITKIGAFLRRSSLDELPQLFNVVKGDMSLVGPRPTSFDVSRYRSWHTARLEVLPGLTGLWQIEGRNDLDFDDRVRLDIAYARNRSLMLDLVILVITIPRVLSARGAY